jgi:hypothetical protein
MQNYKKRFFLGKRMQHESFPDNHEELVYKGWKQIEEDRIACEKEIEKLEIRIRSSITCLRSPARHWAIRIKTGEGRRIGKTHLLRTLAIKILTESEEHAYSVHVLTTCKRRFIQDFGDMPTTVQYMGDQQDNTWEEERKLLDTKIHVFLIDNAKYVDQVRLTAARECARTNSWCFCVEFFNEQDGVPPPEGSFVVDMPQITKTHGDYFPYLADYPAVLLMTIQPVNLYDPKVNPYMGDCWKDVNE